MRDAHLSLVNLQTEWFSSFSYVFRLCNPLQNEKKLDWQEEPELQNGSLALKFQYISSAFVPYRSTQPVVCRICENPNSDANWT